MWRNTPDRYGFVAVLFHWLIAVLFLAQIGLGYLMQGLADQPALQFSLFQWHKSVGLLVLALAVLRLGSSLVQKKPLPLTGTPRWEELAARFMHGVLVAMTILVPLAGWAVASTSPLRIPSFVFNLFVMPDLPLPRSPAAEDSWSKVHELLAYGTGLLVLAHALAALHHHVWRQDGTLVRMVRPRRRGKKKLNQSYK